MNSGYLAGVTEPWTVTGRDPGFGQRSQLAP